MAEDAYVVLGVSNDATDAEIKRAFRKLARQYHPDRNPGDAAAEERFKAIQSAYDAVGSSEARSEYDQKKRMENMFHGGGSSSFGGFGGVDLGSVFSQFMGSRRTSGPGSDFGFNPNEHQTANSTQKVNGADIEAGLDVSMEQAIEGTKVKFSHRRMKKCGECGGSSFGSARRCRTCKGTGVVTRGSTLTVKVPPGAVHGQQLRLKGMGHDHPQGESGDLLITIRLDAKEGRRWENGRLIQEVRVPYTTLQLGGRIRITTPAGKRVEVEIGERTRIGDRRRLKGQGHSGGPLDIEFALLEPERLTGEQVAALERLRESEL